MTKLCSYGCGKIAMYQFKNGKYCCSISKNKCMSVIEFNRIKNIGRKCSEKSKRKMSEAGKNKIFSEIHKKNISVSLKGKKWSEKSKNSKKEKMKNRPGPMKGKIHSEESKSKISILNKGKKRTDLHKKHYSEALKGIKKSERHKEKLRQRMLNGGAAYANSFLANPSKPQVELYNRIKIIYPSAVLNYPLYELNYSLDIAIPELKIWFESDGSYWHQDKEKDLIRQRKIENLGWKCIRYSANSIKEVPTVEKVKEDLSWIM